MVSRICLSAALAPAIALFSPPASAHPTARLHVATLEEAGCPSETEVHDAVAARIGYDPFVAGDGPLIKLAFARKGAGWRATLWIEDAQGKREGERELSSNGPQCGSLLGPTALAIAIVIDPLSLGAPKEPPAPAPPPLPPLPPPLPPPPPQPPPPPPAPPIRWRAGAGAQLAIDTAPAPAAALALFADARRGPWSLGLEAGFDFPAGASTALGNVSSQVLEASILPCYHLDPWFLCLRGAAGALYGTGSGVTESKTATSIYATVGARAGVDWRFTDSWGLEGYGEILGNLDRVSLDINGVPAWTAPPVGARFGVAVFFQIP